MSEQGQSGERYIKINSLNYKHLKKPPLLNSNFELCANSEGALRQAEDRVFEALIIEHPEVSALKRVTQQDMADIAPAYFHTEKKFIRPRSWTLDCEAWRTRAYAELKVVAELLGTTPQGLSDEDLVSFTVAHEVGHFMDSRGMSIEKYRNLYGPGYIEYLRDPNHRAIPQEVSADRFAVDFLKKHPELLSLK